MLTLSHLVDHLRRASRQFLLKSRNNKEAVRGLIRTFTVFTRRLSRRIYSLISSRLLGSSRG